jgi:hypothetical protein
MCVGGRKIFKRIFKKKSVRVSIGFNWLRIGSRRRML